MTFRVRPEQPADVILWWLDRPSSVWLQHASGKPRFFSGVKMTTRGAFPTGIRFGSRAANGFSAQGERCRRWMAN